MDGLDAGLVSDSPVGTDALGVHEDAFAIASLLVSPFVAPPLSVGIFGGRGSGKSFFGQLVRQQVDAMSSHAASDDRMALPERQVVQVSFSAWHHVGNSLARALVLRIYAAFDSTRSARGMTWTASLRQLPTFQRVERRLLDEIAATARVADRAASVLAELEHRYDDAANDRAADASRLKWPAVADHLASKLGPDGCEALDTAGRALGVTALSSASESYADVLAKARVVAGRSAILNEVLVTRRLTRTAGLLAGSLALAALVGLSVYFISVRVEGVDTAVSSAVGLVGVTATVLGFAGAVRARVIQRQAGSAIERVLSFGRVFDGVVAAVDASAERERSRIEERVRVLREQVTDARSRVDRASEAAIVAQSELDRLSERDPVDVIAEQYEQMNPEANTGDGPSVLVMRSDLEALSMLMSTSSRHDDHDLPQRVIVYIDDLDVAPPREIVEVLQAIHLLLAFPPFCVVALADPGALVSALSAWFPLETSASEHTPVDDSRTQYLRKLFQLVLWLPRTEATSVESLIRRLLAVSMEPIDALATPHQSSAVHTMPPPVASVEPSPPPGSQQSFALTAHELNTAVQLAPLFKSPRDAKTFVNTYRLARALLADPTEDFLAEDHAPLMALLAISIATPGLAGELFDTLEAGNSTELLPKPLDVLTGSAPTKNVQILAELVERFPGMPRWVPYARRFTITG